MKKTIVLVCLLLCSVCCFPQEQLVPRSTKSYLIANGSPKDTAFLKEKSRQAGLDLGLPVLANRIPTDSKLVTPKPSEHLLKQGVLQLQLPIDEEQTEFAVYYSELFDQPATINVLQIEDSSPIAAQKRQGKFTFSTAVNVVHLGQRRQHIPKTPSFTNFGTRLSARSSPISKHRIKWPKLKPRKLQTLIIQF